MSTHNIRFYGEMKKIILQLSSNTHLICFAGPCEPPHDKTNKMTVHSAKTGHPHSLIRVFAVCMKKAWVLSYPLSAQQTLIRLGGCPGWSESSLGAQSFCWFCHVVAYICFHFYGTHINTVVFLITDKLCNHVQIVFCNIIWWPLVSNGNWTFSPLFIVFLDNKTQLHIYMFCIMWKSFGRFVALFGLRWGSTAQSTLSRKDMSSTVQLSATVNFLNIWTRKTFAIITLKFEQDGFTKT